MPLALFVLAIALQTPAPAASPVSLANATSVSPAAAASPSAATPPATVPAPEVEDPMDHVSCRYQEPEASHFGSRKACHTRREWLRLQHAG